jgi:hypothetical protein
MQNCEFTLSDQMAFCWVLLALYGGAFAIIRGAFATIYIIRGAFTTIRGVSQLYAAVRALYAVLSPLYAAVLSTLFPYSFHVGNVVVLFASGLQ